MSRVAPTPATGFDFDIETLIVGAGACGLVAALAAHEEGQMVLAVEADPAPSGSTALSAGLVPAAGTRFQRDAGIDDTHDLFAADIQKKAKNENDPALVAALAQGAAPAVEWLADRFSLPFSLVDDFDYPGHSRRRMHGLPTRSGRELIDRLRSACEAAGIDIVCGRRATTLFHDGDRVTGIEATLPDGTTERIGCGRLVLACSGFGGNRAMVAEHMPHIIDAVWFGHDGNQGDAVLWGQGLNAATAQMGAYQGHGNVAHPHGILITWAVITAGGVQVNARGERFWDESQGYSEAARAVLAQPDGYAWAVFDTRIASIARQFADFKDAEAQGAIRTADTLAELADMMGVPSGALTETLDAIPADGTDAFGRPFSGAPLAPPYCAVKVTAALFHTQGGLAVDPATARVKRRDGRLFPNLFAAGGAAVGVSGSGDSGYLSGNGLLGAVVLGRIAGMARRSKSGVDRNV